jgi:hypothetical protein
MRTIALLLALFPAILTFADDEAGVHVIPFGPTTATPVDVHIPSICGFSGQTVTRSGNVFKITLEDPACVLTIPIPYVLSVRLPGLLEPGEYRVEVLWEDDDAVHGGTAFVVRPAGLKPFEIRPFAIPPTGASRMHLTGISCGATCDDVTIDVGGVRATNLVQSGNVVSFDAPPHAPGLVDVTITLGDAVSVSKGALYYFDALERSVFEPVLFPVLFKTSGANGSRWVSEATLSNPRPWFVWNYNTLAVGRQCVTFPCGERIGPGSIERFDDGFPRGALLHVPRPEARDLSFALRVRDVSRQAEGFGTQVPVVRERDFTHGGMISLLDVPLDPRYRVKVRAYVLGPLTPLAGGDYGQVTVRDSVTGAGKLNQSFELVRGEEHQPYYAEIDLPAGNANERVNIYLRFPLDATAWAFGTVTNNETQQVTIVTPNGSGELPCTSCVVP